MIVRRLAAVTVLAFSLTGCGVTALDLPVPGGSVRGPSYEITGVFQDALNLPAKAHVKLEGVGVGRVTDISTKDYRAVIRMRIRDEVKLPEGTTMELRQATPLGEVFVALIKPAKGGPPLEAGTVLGIEHTAVAPSVEDTLAAMSVIVNGGSAAQVRTIVTEINKALTGRETETKHLFHQLDSFVSELNESTADIDRALLAMDRVSTTLNSRRATIDAALRDFTPAAAQLADQTKQLTQLLVKLGQLGEVSSRVINQTRADILAQLRQMGPLLDQLNTLNPKVAPTFRHLIAFAKLIDRATPGEYLNVDIHARVGVSELPPGLPIPGAPDLPLLDQIIRPLGGVAERLPGGLVGGGGGDGLLGISGLLGGGN